MSGHHDPQRALEQARDALAVGRDLDAEQRDEAARAREEAAGRRRRDRLQGEADRRERAASAGASESRAFVDSFLAGRAADDLLEDRVQLLADERWAASDRDAARQDRLHAAEDRKQAAHDRSEHEQLERQLREGLAARAVIGQAQGLLMARHGLSTQGAHDWLATAAQERTMDLRDVAQRLVDGDL